MKMELLQISRTCTQFTCPAVSRYNNITVNLRVVSTRGTHCGHCAHWSVLWVSICRYLVVKLKHWKWTGQLPDSTRSLNLDLSGLMLQMLAAVCTYQVKVWWRNTNGGSSRWISEQISFSAVLVLELIIKTGCQYSYFSWSIWCRCTFCAVMTALQVLQVFCSAVKFISFDVSIQHFFKQTHIDWNCESTPNFY